MKKKKDFDIQQYCGWLQEAVADKDWERALVLSYEISFACELENARAAGQELGIL